MSDEVTIDVVELLEQVFVSRKARRIILIAASWI